MKTLTAAAAIVAAMIVALCVVAPATASPDEPTTGDRILYIFESDVQENAGSFWFDANNEINGFTETVLPDFDGGRARWLGAVRVTSASTYQSTTSTFQTNGHYAACRTYVNDTLVAQDWATGQYAVATC